MKAKPQILIVEDEAIVALLIEEHLIDLSYEVVGIASTVATALAVIQTGPRLDGVLLDVWLRDGQTFTVADELLARHVPFAFMTGYGAGLIRDRRFETVPVLAKPFKLTELDMLLSQLLQRVD
ncbi:response regulator [Acidisoma cladoniae]|uniref:response regulator n=1 Tax=Acidisoma cladoniae TaxID=3040935 RepID=UPI00254BF331|nr:response regulator [Acidisoma sp. PAMC 29798]